MLSDGFTGILQMNSLQKSIDSLSFSALVVLHMIAKGIFYKENAFLKDPWCILLALVVVAAWCDTVYVFGNYMFWVVLFGFKTLAKSTHPYLAIARMQVNVEYNIEYKRGRGG